MKYKNSEDDSERGWYMDYPKTEEVIRRLEEQGVFTEEEILESILNTNVFVDECEEIVFNRHFKIPNIHPDLSYDERVQLFKKHINEQYKKDPLKSKEKIEGIRWEVQQFADSGTIDYPIMSEAIVSKAVNQYGATITRTARGSASSFVTNKLIGLTTIDRFNSDIPLYAERFLTKERILSGSAPDIDLNCAAQEPMVAAAREVLGEHSCYPLMAITFMKEKAAWQMYASVKGVTPEQANTVSKCLDNYNKTKMHSGDPDSVKIENFIPDEYLAIYNESIAYQGIAINLIGHPCAHIVFDGDVRREIGLISALSEASGERTLVAAAEGKYLDSFGYVKEDFLIVDTVALTHKLYSSIGEEVPSFEELKELVKDDKPTWEIYDKGITCCVNQIEGDGTTLKAMKYKPQNIAELAGLIAGIRPGFKSLINTFIERTPYSTGESSIDELLENSQHFMLYQESIMKILAFLGVDMGESYTIIKSLAKKKLTGEKKDKLLKELKEKWLEKIGNLDNFNKVWQVIEDSAKYSFNACVTGDTRIYTRSSDTRGMSVEKLMICKLSWGADRLGYALSINEDTLDTVANKIIDVRFAGVRPVYYVLCRSGHSICCTDNHKFPTPNGYKMLSELKEGDEIYSVYRGDHKARTDKILLMYEKPAEAVYDVEMADPFHNFVVNDGIVTGNSHAYAMAGDSLYTAYFKAHHPYKFYEVAINHYQDKDDKDEINSLIEEARKFYGLKLGSWRFGVDNSRVSIDEEKKIIQPSLSSVKGIGKAAAPDLFAISQKIAENDSFIRLLSLMKECKGVNTAVRNKLISIDYFHIFGTPNELLRQAAIFDKLFSRATIKSADLEPYNLGLEDIKHLCEKVTAKTAKGFDSIKLIEFIVAHTKMAVTGLLDYIRLQYRVLGYVSITDNRVSNGLFVVTAIEGNKRKRITLYSVKNGASRQTVAWESSIKNLHEGDIIRVKTLKKDFKRVPKDIDGERKRVKTDEPEFWLKGWKKC